MFIEAPRSCNITTTWILSRYWALLQVVEVVLAALARYLRLLPGVSALPSLCASFQTLRMIKSRRVLMRGGAWVRLWPAVAQVLLLTVTAVGENDITLKVGADGRVREAMITGATCYELCQVFMTFLELDGIWPSSKRGEGHRGILIETKSADPPPIPCIPCQQLVAWLDFVRVLVNKYRVALLAPSSRIYLLARASLRTQTSLNNILYDLHHSFLHELLVAIVARGLVVRGFVGYALYRMT